MLLVPLAIKKATLRRAYSKGAKVSWPDVFDLFFDYRFAGVCVCVCVVFERLLEWALDWVLHVGTLVRCFSTVVERFRKAAV